MNGRHPQSVPILRLLSTSEAAGQLSIYLITTMHRALKVCYNISFWLPSPSSEPTWSCFKISRPWSKEDPSLCAIPPRPPTPGHQLTSVTATPMLGSTASLPPTPAQREFLKLMVIAFHGPLCVYFEKVRPDTAVCCLGVFSKRQYESDKVNCCSSRKQLGGHKINSRRIQINPKNKTK